MDNTDNSTTPWYAKGLLFENCSCTLVCPGHVHFSQPCTHDRCLGYWAIRVDEGRFGGTNLVGMKMVVTYDSPQHMIEGGWVQQIVIDERADQAQRNALETIITGQAGGPWGVLARFVGTRLPTEYRRVDIVEEGRLKKVNVAGFLESTVEDIKSRDKVNPVTLGNMFNQIHAATQGLALGTSSCSVAPEGFNLVNTHGLHSRFSWSVK
jgi:hypothetical protein